MTLPGVAAAVDAAVSVHGLPGVTVMVTDAAGVLHRSDHGDAGAQDVWRLYSMSKLVGVLAALRLVDAGRLSLAQPVGAVVPEFDALPVLDGFDGDKPRLRPQRARASILDLATHRSGAAYGIWHKEIAAYMRATGLRAIDDESVAGLSAVPLAFDPGTGFAYGTGIDWLGLVVERVTGEPVERFVQREIFDPVGAGGLAFALDADQRARLRPAWRATGQGFAPLEMTRGPKGEFYGMGAALSGSAEAYLAVLRALLVPGAILPAPLLARLAKPNSTLSPPLRSMIPSASADVDILCGAPIGYGLGGLIALADVPGRRHAGAYGWAGMQNTHFWVDPSAGIAGVIMMQHLPFADAPAMAALSAFETAVYAAL